MKRKIYLASSWRNPHYETALDILRLFKHEVYDFKKPADYKSGFSWKDTLPHSAVEDWGPSDLMTALAHPFAQQGFLSDFSAMKWCDTLVLLLPCGRSAHLEAGWAVAAGKNVHIFLHPDKFEPELMYLMADAIHETLECCIAALR